jgi:hypothetical protein
MSKTLQRVMRVINTQQGHLKRVARKIDALRKKKGASTGRKKRRR